MGRSPARALPGSPSGGGNRPAASERPRILLIFNFTLLSATSLGGGGSPRLVANGGTKTAEGFLLVCLLFVLPPPLPVSLLHVRAFGAVSGSHPAPESPAPEPRPPLPGLPAVAGSSGAPGGSGAGKVGLVPPSPARRFFFPVFFLVRDL